MRSSTDAADCARLSPKPKGLAELSEGFSEPGASGTLAWATWQGRREDLNCVDAMDARSAAPGTPHAAGLAASNTSTAGSFFTFRPQVFARPFCSRCTREALAIARHPFAKLHNPVGIEGIPSVRILVGKAQIFCRRTARCFTTSNVLPLMLLGFILSFHAHRPGPSSNPPAPLWAHQIS